MLNSKTNTRELAYVVNIDTIEPISGSDNCECAIVGGWHVMVRKNEFKAGDPAIYFEIDSYLDSSNSVFFLFIFYFFLFFFIPIIQIINTSFNFSRIF